MNQTLRLAIVFVLTGCAAAAAPSMSGGALIATPAYHPPTPKPDAYLYVTNAANQNQGSITVYDPKTKGLLYTVTIGVFDPVASATDAYGDLYVANRETKNVTMYVPGSLSYSLLIKKGIVVPRKLKFDPAGNLNVVDASRVTVFAARSGTLVRTIEAGLSHPISIAFDPEGSLFVLNYDRSVPQTNIVEYAPGGTAPERTFSNSTEFATAEDLEYGPDGYLYVATTSSVVVIDPSTGSTVRTISDGIAKPTLMNFDNEGNLFVANKGSGNKAVSVYAAGTTSPLYQITEDDTHVFALLFNRQNDLLLGSQRGGLLDRGAIAEFAPGATKPKRFFKAGMYHPLSADFGQQ